MRFFNYAILRKFSVYSQILHVCLAHYITEEQILKTENKYQKYI